MSSFVGRRTRRGSAIDVATDAHEPRSRARHSIAKMKPSLCHRAIGECHKHKLFYHEKGKCTRAAAAARARVLSRVAKP